MSQLIGPTEDEESRITNRSITANGKHGSAKTNLQLSCRRPTIAKKCWHFEPKKCPCRNKSIDAEVCLVF